MCLGSWGFGLRVLGLLQSFFLRGSIRVLIGSTYKITGLSNYRVINKVPYL